MNTEEQKYYDMARIAKKQGASVVTITEMLIRVGCEYDKSMDIAVDVLYEENK